MTTLVRIGYWRGDATAAAWPDVTTFVAPSWNAEDRALVVDHLRFAALARAYMGLSPCRICGIHNGSLELTDGTYLWLEGLVHYVQAHDVRLPEVFVRHAREIRERHEDAEVDDRWWRGIEPDWT